MASNPQTNAKHFDRKFYDLAFTPHASHTIVRPPAHYAFVRHSERSEESVYSFRHSEGATATEESVSQ